MCVMPGRPTHLRILLRRRRRRGSVRQRPEREVELRRGAAQAQRLAVVDLRRAALAGAVPQRHLAAGKRISAERAARSEERAGWTLGSAVELSKLYAAVSHAPPEVGSLASPIAPSQTYLAHSYAPSPHWQEMSTKAKRRVYTAQGRDGDRQRTCLAPLKMRASHLLLCGCQRTPRNFEDAEALRAQTRR